MRVELGPVSLRVDGVPGLAHQEEQEGGDPVSHVRGRVRLFLAGRLLLTGGDSLVLRGRQTRP